MVNLGNNFYPKLIQVSSELGMKPEDLLLVMVSESGINPSAKEPKFGGGGLLGFMPDTLKSLKFSGTSDDFLKLSGEEQLDWVKKLVKGFEGMNGGPFTSAAQYYVGNFFPVALKLPGIRAGDPSTVFLEENPQIVRNKKTNKAYSKKYFDIGLFVSPSLERNAYKENPLFHGPTKGAITYGDMINQINKNKNSPIYIKAISDMKKATNYTPSQESSPKSFSKEPKSVEPKSVDNKSVSKSPSFLDKLKEIFKTLLATDSEKLLYKKYLPKNNILIKINSHRFDDQVEFANILCTGLDEALLSNSFIHTDGNDVEVECNIHGPQKECFKAVAEVSNYLLPLFKQATHKIYEIDINLEYLNKKSNLKPINIKVAESSHRKFLLKFIKG